MFSKLIVGNSEKHRDDVIRRCEQVRTQIRVSHWEMSKLVAETRKGRVGNA